MRPEGQNNGARGDIHCYAMNMQATIEGFLGNGVFCLVRPEAI
jgi:hypothetical protein